MRVLLDNLEIYLTVAGRVVVWGAAAVLGATGLDTWLVAAVTALTVSVLHGGIFWAVRRRQRILRAKMVHDIREMLTDEVLNQLSVMKMMIPEGAGRVAYESHFREISESIDTVARMVDGLSEERLQVWQGEYTNAAEHVAFNPTAA